MARRVAVVALVFALAVGAMAATTTSTKGLVAHFKLDKGEGDTVFDTGPSKLKGKIIGAKWVKTPHGPALEFDGKSAYVDCGSGKVLGLADKLSISAWVHPKAIPEGEPAIGGEDPRTYALTYYKTGKAYFYPVGSGGFYVSAPLKTGSLYHLAGTFDGKTVKLYVNGTLKASKELDEPRECKRGGKLVIGGGNRAKSFFNGIIDDVRIYNRALCAEEVKKLHAERAKVKKGK